MIGSGIIACIMDVIFLIVYLSFIRRICKKSLYTNSIFYLLKEVWSEGKNLKGVAEVSKKHKERKLLKNALENMAMGNLEIILEESNFHGAEREMAKSINCIKEEMKKVMKHIKNLLEF